MRCFECGHSLSSKWDAFLALKEYLVSQDTDNDKKFIDPDLNQNLIPVFEALNIEKYCCRMHFTTSRNIHNF